MQNLLSLWLNAGAQITHGSQFQRPRCHIFKPSWRPDNKYAHLDSLPRYVNRPNHHICSIFSYYLYDFNLSPSVRQHNTCSNAKFFTGEIVTHCISCLKSKNKFQHLTHWMDIVTFSIKVHSSRNVEFELTMRVDPPNSKHAEEEHAKRRKCQT